MDAEHRVEGDESEVKFRGRYGWIREGGPKKCPVTPYATDSLRFSASPSKKLQKTLTGTGGAVELLVLKLLEREVGTCG
jgi:hypothetical protein